MFDSNLIIDENLESCLGIQSQIFCFIQHLYANLIFYIHFRASLAWILNHLSLMLAPPYSLRSSTRKDVRFQFTYPFLDHLASNVLVPPQHGRWITVAIYYIPALSLLQLVSALTAVSDTDVRYIVFIEFLKYRDKRSVIIENNKSFLPTRLSDRVVSRL